MPPRLKPHLVRYDLEDELLLYDPTTQEVLLLNASAAAIAELADGTRSADEIAALCHAQVNGNPQDVARDVRVTLEELARLGMLEANE